MKPAWYKGPPMYPTHIVVGWNEREEYGVHGMFDNEFEAYRMRRHYNSLGGDVSIEPYKGNIRCRVSDKDWKEWLIESFLHFKRNYRTR